MWLCLQFKSTYHHVFGSKEVHMEHVLKDKLLYQKIIVFWHCQYIDDVEILEDMFFRNWLCFRLPSCH